MSCIPPLPPAPHIAFLHTSPLHVTTFDHLLSERLPLVSATHAVDVSLLDEVRRDGPTIALRERLTTQLDQIAETSPDLVVCTCSSIGPLVEGQIGHIPVIRVDRPMAEAAVRWAAITHRRVGFAYASDSTIGPTSDLLASIMHEHRPTTFQLAAIPCIDAWEAFVAEDLQEYARIIANTVQHAAAHVDVICLAQASMAVAMPLLADVAIPVLTSPPTLIDSLITAISGQPS